MPIYLVTITIRTPTQDVYDYTRQQRAHTAAAAKWSVLRKWGQRPESQTIDVQRLEITAAPVDVTV